ncbi:flagellar basal body protein FliL [Micromonospora inaquosa]|uniref:Flagellar basal body protein FliL n=1 Tax=Micromonospora inaquosa TaxID=2203716 RepID=A0A3N9W0S5_9ACTN|nr:flagellar basal body protein FliL [Micromonospora inaquosa]
MTNYGQPGGGHPGPWRGQRPDETPGHPTQQPYPPASESYPPAVPSYPPAPQGRPGPYGDPPTAGYGGGTGTPYGAAPGAPYGGSYQPTPTYGGQPPYQPADQYGGQPSYQPGDPYGGQPPYQPADQYGGQPSYQPGDAYGEDPAPGRRGRGPLIAVLAVVLLVAIAGAFWFRSGRSDPAPAAAPSSSAVADEPSADVVEPAPSAAAPESSADPRFAKVGQCVRNEGAAGGKPKLLISGCTAKSYEVLSRIDGPTSGERDAETKCDKVKGYTNWYFFDSELDTLDFVLCLKQR